VGGWGGGGVGGQTDYFVTLNLSWGWVEAVTIWGGRWHNKMYCARYSSVYSNIFGYSIICLWIMDIQIWILEIWLFKYIRIHIRSKIVFCKERIYKNIFRCSNICPRILDIRLWISKIWLFEYVRIRSKNRFSPYSGIAYRNRNNASGISLQSKWNRTLTKIVL
jgi:hypothetical protein